MGEVFFYMAVSAKCMAICDTDDIKPINYLKIVSFLVVLSIKKPANHIMTAGQIAVVSGQKPRPGDVLARAGNATCYTKHSRFRGNSKLLT